MNATETKDTARLEAIFNLTREFANTRQWDSLLNYADQLYQEAHSTGDQVYQGQGKFFAGLALSNMQAFDTALHRFIQSYDAFSQVDRGKEMARALVFQGQTYRSLRSYQEAEQVIQEGISLAAQVKDTIRMQSGYFRLADVYSDQGEVVKAIEATQNVLTLLMAYGPESSMKARNEASVRNNLAARYKLLGDIPSAVEQYFNARAIYEKYDFHDDHISTLNNLAGLFASQNEFERSLSYYLEAIAMAEQTGSQHHIAHSYTNLIHTYRQLGQMDKSLEVAQESFEIIEENEFNHLKGTAYTALGITYLRMEEWDKAEKLFVQGLEFTQSYGTVFYQLDPYFYLSSIMIQKGEWNRAAYYAEQGYMIAVDLKNRDKELKLLENLVKTQVQLGNTNRALALYDREKSLRDSLNADENIRVLLNREYQYTYEQKAYQDSVASASLLAIQKEESLRRKTISWFLAGGLGLMIIFGLVLMNRYRLIREQKSKMDQANAELKVAYAKLQELDDFKSSFFTNISHEFRTPLTVIQGMIGQVREKPEKWLEKGSDIIQRNTDSLLNLINQILDLRKLESGNLKLEFRRGDVIKFLRLGVASFESMAEMKGVVLRFETEDEMLEMDFDSEKLSQIQTNLVSNALKFTPKGGQVCLQVSQQENLLLITVQDTGMGIPPDKLSLIFDRFYQVDSTATREGEGTGIGLSLTKELVQLMDGTIEVQSELGQGTLFTVKLPISTEAEPAIIPPVPAVNVQHEAGVTPAFMASPGETNLPSLLIIEDNPDIVAYLFACLEDQYELSSAPNGQAGIEAAFEQVPDLIITDVMMPLKNGYEVTETLKLDERTSHIPIVMLTAKADQASRLQGYQRGADAYLPKPFDQQELTIRLAKLLELRQRLQARYQSAQPPESEDPNVQLEDSFIRKARECVLAHLDDNGYRGESLCRDLAMSRVNLHRKLKALTGLPISHFIRKVRIAAAQDMLLNKEEPISGIAYAVGFKDPSYFNRVFGEVTGMSPSEWRENQTANIGLKGLE